MQTSDTDPEGTDRKCVSAAAGQRKDHARVAQPCFPGFVTVIFHLSTRKQRTDHTIRVQVQARGSWPVAVRLQSPLSEPHPLAFQCHQLAEWRRLLSNSHGLNPVPHSSKCGPRASSRSLGSLLEIPVLRPQPRLTEAALWVGHNLAAPPLQSPTVMLRPSVLGWGDICFLLFCFVFNSPQNCDMPSGLRITGVTARAGLPGSHDCATAHEL